MNQTSSEAATGSTAIAGNVTTVAAAAADTSAGVTQSRTATEDLTHMAASLQQAVSHFRY